MSGEKLVDITRIFKNLPTPYRHAHVHRYAIAEPLVPKSCIWPDTHYHLGLPRLLSVDRCLLSINIKAHQLGIIPSYHSLVGAILIGLLTDRDYHLCTVLNKVASKVASTFQFVRDWNVF